MGREIRMVPEGWEHPKKADGNYKPLMGYKFSKCLMEWEEDRDQWLKGLRRKWNIEGPDSWVPIEADDYFSDYVNDKPNPEDYMPEFQEGTANHYMMYEDTSEGTPISPSFATPEELARWLADNGASSFGSMTASYEDWLATIKIGSAPSAVFDAKGFRSGVEASNK